MRTSKEWHDYYLERIKKHLPYADYYHEAREEAIGAGLAYMQGRLTVNEVLAYARTTGVHFPFEFSKTARLIEKGAAQAVQDGTALASRVQPVQEPATLAVCKKRRRTSTQERKCKQ